MPWPSQNLLSNPAPVLRRYTVWFIVLVMLFSVLGVASILVRKWLGIPNRGWIRFLPLALALTPILVIAPLWWWRTRWIRRAVRESGWRLCTHCAYDVSTLAPSGTCPECGQHYDVEKDAALWADAGVKPPQPAPPQ